MYTFLKFAVSCRPGLHTRKFESELNAESIKLLMIKTRGRLLPSRIPCAPVYQKIPNYNIYIFFLVLFCSQYVVMFCCFYINIKLLSQDFIVAFDFLLKISILMPSVANKKKQFIFIRQRFLNSRLLG